MGLGVSAAEESGVSEAEESEGLSSRRIWGLSSIIIWGSQQQNNMRVSAAEEYGTGGLSSKRIWGVSSSKGVSAACRASSAIAPRETKGFVLHSLL